MVATQSHRLHSASDGQLQQDLQSLHTHFPHHHPQIRSEPQDRFPHHITYDDPHNPHPHHDPHHLYGDLHPGG